MAAECRMCLPPPFVGRSALKDSSHRARPLARQDFVRPKARSADTSTGGRWTFPPFPRQRSVWPLTRQTGKLHYARKPRGRDRSLGQLSHVSRASLRSGTDRPTAAALSLWTGVRRRILLARGAGQRLRHTCHPTLRTPPGQARRMTRAIKHAIATCCR